jgi:hypothetical protein
LWFEGGLGGLGERLGVAWVVATGKWRKGVGSRRLRSGFKAPDQGCIGTSVGLVGVQKSAEKAVRERETPKNLEKLDS